MRVTIIDTYTDKEKCDKDWVGLGQMLRRMGKTQCSIRREEVRLPKGYAWRLSLVERDEEE